VSPPQGDQTTSKGERHVNYSTENLLPFLVIGIIAGKIMKGAGYGLLVI
jgi:hypothetical protein